MYVCVQMNRGTAPPPIPYGYCTHTTCSGRIDLIMPTDYRKEAEQIQQELAQLEQQIAQQQDERQRLPLQARRGSLLRSLDWYARRIPGRTVEALGVQVADEVNTATEIV